MKNKNVEILSPVSDWEMCKAAVHNGAHAIYTGMPGFNARARSKDWNITELSEIITFCHSHDVKVFLAFNILIFQNELQDVEKALLEILPLEPDAFILQDIGLIRLIHDLCPEQTIHASTQMTTTHYRNIVFFKDLNLKRYVLSREMSMKEIALCKEKIKNEPSIQSTELEVFVHGALCVAYSGQCLTSERTGGRSANRGQCSQSCRLPYELFANDKKIELGSKKYLVSPKDLCGLDDFDELVSLGIESFKIEGRYKSPEYVALTTKAYSDKTLNNDSPTLKNQIDIAYSRGTFSGWLNGVDHNQLVSGTNNHHIGLKIGTVIKTCHEKFTAVILKTGFRLNKGDSLLFFTKNYLELCGSQIFDIQILNDGSIKCSLSKDINSFQLNKAYYVYLNRSPSLDKEIQRGWKDKAQHKKIMLKLKISGNIGEPLNICYSDDFGNQYTGFSSINIELANAKPLKQSAILSVFSALGNTPYQLASSNIEIQDDIFLPHKILKQLRQKCIEEFHSLRNARKNISIKQHSSLLLPTSVANKPENNTASLHVLIRDPKQLGALKGEDIDTVYLDYSHGVRYEESITQIKAMGFKAGIAAIRILKPGKEHLLKKIASSSAEVVLVRNPATQHWFSEHCPELKCIADFSFNITNTLSFDYINKKGFNRITPSYDLNIQQLKDMLIHVDCTSVEITVHQYMPMFHMEHCVFATFLSDGSSIADCGLVCRKNELQLKDEQGVKHVIKADKDCKNTLFHGEAQSTATFIPELLDFGVKHFRIEALNESHAELRKKIKIYSSILSGESNYNTGLTDLNIIEKYGVGSGQLTQISSHIDRKK